MGVYTGEKIPSTATAQLAGSPSVCSGEPESCCDDIAAPSCCWCMTDPPSALPEVLAASAVDPPSMAPTLRVVLPPSETESSSEHPVSSATTTKSDHRVFM